MMSSIRKQLKSTGFKIILWAAGISILGGGSLLLFIKNSVSKKPITDIAFVNGLPISQVDFNGAVGLLKQFIRIAPQLMPNLTERGLVDFALENILIPKKILQSQAEKSGINVGVDYVGEKLRDENFGSRNLGAVLQQNVYKNGRLDSNLLSQALKNQHMSFDQLEATLKENLETNIFNDLLTNSVYVSAHSIHEKYIQDYSKKKFNILRINIDDYIKKAEAEKIDHESIENYFNSNKELYRVPEQRSVILWSFDPNNYDIEVTEQDLQDYYKNQNKDDKSFEELKPELEKEVRLNKFKQEFNLDAKKLTLESDNPTVFDEFVKNKHGIRSELDNIPNNNNMLSKKVFSISKVGDKNFYYNENKGYIAEVKSINHSYIPDLESIEDKVTKDIYMRKAKVLLDLDLDKAMQSSNIIEQIEKEFKDSKLEKTDWIDLQKGNNIFKEVPKDIFINLFELGQKAKYINNKGYLIELIELEPFNQKDFDDKREALENALEQEQAQNIITDLQAHWRSKAKIVFNENLVIN